MHQSELRAAFTGAQLIIYTRTFFEEVGYIQKYAITLWEDNTAARDFSVDEMHQSRIRHLEVKYHFLREYSLKGVVDIQYVNTERQLADIFTKALDSVAFLRHSSRMLVLPPDVEET